MMGAGCCSLGVFRIFLVRSYMLASGCSVGLACFAQPALKSCSGGLILVRACESRGKCGCIRGVGICKFSGRSSGQAFE